MKKIILITTLFIYLPNFYAKSWQQLGFSDVKEEKNKTTMNREEIPIKIEYNQKKLSMELKSKIISNIEKFLAFREVQVKKIHIKVLDDIEQYQLIISELKIKQKEYVKYLPSGLLFENNKSLQYNFRLFVSKIFVRVSGYYSHERELLNKIAEAVADPRAYLRKRNPNYLHSQLMRFKQQVKEQFSQLKKTQTESLLKNQVERTQLKLKIENLNKRLSKLRQATIALANQGWFSGPEFLSKKLIEKILAIKASNPKLNQEKIEDILEKEKVEFSSKAIKLILIVYFNEIED